MRTSTPLILLPTFTLGAAATHGTLSLMMVLALVGGMVLGGCGPAMTRPPVAQEELVKLRSANDERWTTGAGTVTGRWLKRTKTEYDRYTAGERKQPPVIDVLIISGGGDWGAFGAGFLKGWLKVPAQHPLAMPEFDIVTGVSTGTLIAPFAFLGDEQSIEAIVHLYRHPQEDWVKQRGILLEMLGVSQQRTEPLLPQTLIWPMKALLWILFLELWIYPLIDNT